MADDVFATVAQTPAVQRLRQRVEQGGALSCTGLNPAAQPFFAALLFRLFPKRPIVVITDGLKTQEGFQQDLETWLRLEDDSVISEQPKHLPVVVNEKSG